MSVQDNGNELISATTTVKESDTDGGVSGQAVIRAGETPQTFDFYNQAGKQVFKAGDSDTYYVGSNAGWSDRRDHAPQDAAFGKEMENVVDALVGNLKNQVSLSGSSDGGQTVHLKLTGSQIPAVANIVGSILVKHALNAHPEQAEPGTPSSDPFGLDIARIAAALPKLTDDIKIAEVALHAAIDGNNLLEQPAGRLHDYRERRVGLGAQSRHRHGHGAVGYRRDDAGSHRPDGQEDGSHGSRQPLLLIGSVES